MPDRLLPCRPKPATDECFSSWLKRVALGNCAKIQTFCHLLWPNRQLWNRDLDAFAPIDIVSDLARHTGTTQTTAEATTLRAFQGVLYEAVLVRTATPWIFQLGIWHRTHKRSGQQWCPACLQGDIPYYRRNWRLALSSTCSQHGIVLADRCHGCGSPAVPHRASDPCCHICGADRREHPPVYAYPEALQLERRMRALLASDISPQSELEALHPLAYYGAVRCVLGLLASNPRSARLRGVIASRYGGDPRPPSYESGARGFDVLSTSERHRLMGLAAPLLRDWPDKFAKLCADAGMWRSWALRGRGAPFAYEEVVKQHLTAG
jgi:hypothetical protein